MHDDDLDARCEAIRRKPHWERTCYDWDDLDSQKQIATLKAMNERRWRNQPAAGYRVLWGNPPRPRTKPLGDILREIGCKVVDEWVNPSPSPWLR
jgi:hypothetical protein